ncbi:hypothetical protein [Naasia sp. SYSU D00948]|uniref:hypothetical protein n=1 Tax=Naasia sp. SYSU D00948 TaxID=2817379 RepID=UPI001B316A54|nr:hypothetical protein [Naasia sp. SYSU D00948]
MPEAPLFRDPVFDGAADPTVVRSHSTGQWWMFYTQRRATAEEPGVAWVHGSAIGVAVSDTGEHWEYRGTAGGLATPGITHWAPEVIPDGDGYRMYVTLIDGVPDRWEGHPRRIAEYRSDDLDDWRFVRDLPLSSDRVIDAAFERCADGVWRLWYKDEADGSTTWAATSPDLETWSVEGRVIAGAPHEGPNVFRLGGWYWLIVDEWRGLRVHRSTDGIHWKVQQEDDGLILARPGSRAGDGTVGRHADVVVAGDTAWIFYFTHPEWDGALDGADELRSRISWIQAAPLRVEGGVLRCDRDSRAPLLLTGAPSGEGPAPGAR